MCDRRTMSQCRVQTFHASRFRPSAPLSFWVGAMSVGLVVPPVHATGQDREVLEATTVMAESPEGYTRIVGVRELSDGRVLIVDQVERFVYLLSRDLSRESVIGSRGQGPGEYQQVSRIIPLEGDSSALGTDRGYLMVTPELDIEGRLPWERSFRVMDRLGYMYGMSPESQTRLALRREIRTPEMDSVTIVRWHRDGSPDGAELVGVVPQLVQPAVISQRIPFQPQPLYHVSPDGTLIIAHPEPFHLEMIRSDGGWQRGPEIAYQPVRVTEGHREAWREERRRPRVGLRVPIGRDQPGQAQVVTTTYRVDEPSEWPEELPPFLSDALSFDGDDRLWIRRTTEAGAPPRFDVFDREGRLAHEVRLPEGTRLVGFGDGVAYVVRKDQFDLEYLQRIQLP